LIEQIHSFSVEEIEKLNDDYRKILFPQRIQTLPILDKFAPKSPLDFFWFVEYEPRADQDNSSPPKFDPFLTIGGVTTEGVFKKKTEERFQNYVDKEIFRGVEYEEIFVADKDNQIAVAETVGGSSIVTIALKDHTIKVIDLVQSEPQKPFIMAEFQPDVDPEIPSIIKSLLTPPHQDFLLFSPNIYEFYKMDKNDGSVTKVRNMIDGVRHLLSPVPTALPEKDNFQTASMEDPEVNERIRTSSASPYFMGTGDTNGLNFVADWTTMQPIFYFWSRPYGVNVFVPNLDLGFVETDVILGITYVGHLPRLNMFAYVITDETVNNINFATTYHERVGNVLTFNGAKVYNLQWINTTSYLLAFKTDRSNLWYDIDTGGSFTATSFQIPYQKVDIFSIDLEYGGLTDSYFDYFFGSITLFESGFLYLANNHADWKECNDFSSGGKTYGRYRVCSSCHYVYEQADSSELAGDPGNEFYRNCKVDSCPAGQQMHSTYLNDDDYYVHECLDEYIMPEIEKSYANDNGCQPGFNKFSRYDRCIECEHYLISSSGFIDIGLTDLSYSTCYTLNQFRDIFPAFYPLPIWNYTKDQLQTEYWIKGSANSQPQTYEKLYFEDKLGEVFLASNFEVNHENVSRITIFRNQNITGYLKRCYRFEQELTTDLNNVKYTFSVDYPYEQKARADFPKIVSDVDLGIPELDEFFCYLDCASIAGVGYYYDYNLAYCRRCTKNCQRCTDLEDCQLCIPGFNPKVESLYHPLSEEDDKKVCFKGCQPGFYLRVFYGHCFECEQNCLVCQDTYGLRIENTGLEDSACVKCTDETTRGQSLVLNSRTRKCIPKDECKVGGSTKLIIRNVTFQKTWALQEFCVQCEENCLACDELKYWECFECDSDYRLENGNCIFIESSDFFLVFMISVGVIIVLIIVCIVVAKAYYKRRKNRKYVTYTLNLRIKELN
jgi:hypothetical protein